MNNGVIPHGAMDESRIDPRNYSTSLTAEAFRTGIISESDIDRLQSKSMEALAEVIGYYTQKKSASVKSETARTLAKSLIYNVDTYLLSLNSHTEALSVLLERKMGELYGKGYLINKKYYDDARQLYAKVRYTRLNNASEEYNKTLDQYFKYYLTKYSPKFTADLKIYLSLSEYGLFGNYHINESITVLTKLLEINRGTESDYFIDETDDGSVSAKI